MGVVTISRQYGAGGSAIARLLAQKLQWPLIDNEFIDRVAERAGLSPEEVAQHEERVPGLVERLAQALALASPEVLVATGEQPDARFRTEEDMVRATEVVIKEAVRGGDLILVGRGAQAVLAERADALHVFIVAPRDRRVEAVRQRLDVDASEAEERVDRVDRGRRSYVKTYYHRQWDDPANYDLVVNTGTFAYERAAELIADAVALRGFGSS